MEVASPPIALQPAPRHSRYSPMLDSSNKRGGVALAAEEERSAKRCRFVMDVDALSEDFSSHSLFYKNNGAPSMSVAAAAAAASPASFKRSRAPESRSRSPTARDEWNRVVQEQATLIESLQKDKSGLEDSLRTLQTDHQRVVKENGILRKAVMIQQERQNTAETEIKVVKDQADERIRSLEQIILSLRYHLQQQQRVGNDFMRQTPPDVY